jgi:hypothetical protein
MTQLGHGFACCKTRRTGAANAIDISTSAPGYSYAVAIQDIKWLADWPVSCFHDPRRPDSSLWPSRCALPCVQYGQYDELYIEPYSFPGTSRKLCACGGGLLAPYSMAHNQSDGRAVATQLALLDWWDANVEEDLTSSRWRDPAWTAQGAWLGGSSLRDATWDLGASYCSWPFVECTTSCLTSYSLAALDFRNASLYVPQLNFSAFEDRLTEDERQDVWYM